MAANDAEKLFEALRAEYLTQLPETLSRLETRILAWPAGRALPMELKRDVHSLKGAAGTYGLGFVTDACHHLEDFLTAERPGGDHQTYIDVLLRYVDLMRDFVAFVAGGGDKSSPEYTARLAELAEPGKPSTVRVLVVEPALSMSHAYQRLLSAHGLAVSICSSGYEAIGRLIREGYDAVLTSYETTDISGLSLARAARAIAEISPALKVVLITSNDLAGSEQAVNRLVRKDRSLEVSLAEALGAEGLLE